MRRILVFTHTGRKDAIAAAIETSHQLANSGIVPVMRRQDQHAVIGANGDNQGEDALHVEILGEDCQMQDIDLGWCLAATARCCTPRSRCGRPTCRWWA